MRAYHNSARAEAEERELRLAAFRDKSRRAEAYLREGMAVTTIARILRMSPKKVAHIRDAAGIPANTGGR